jgi:hypothetical protein
MMTREQNRLGLCHDLRGDVGRRGAGWVGFGEGDRELEGLESEVESNDSSVRSGRRGRWRQE